MSTPVKTILMVYVQEKIMKNKNKIVVKYGKLYI